MVAYFNQILTLLCAFGLCVINFLLYSLYRLSAIKKVAEGEEAFKKHTHTLNCI